MTVPHTSICWLMIIGRNVSRRSTLFRKGSPIGFMNNELEEFPGTTSGRDKCWISCQPNTPSYMGHVRWTRIIMRLHACLDIHGKLVLLSMIYSILWLGFRMVCWMQYCWAHLLVHQWLFSQWDSFAPFQPSGFTNVSCNSTRQVRCLRRRLRARTESTEISCWVVHD